MPILQGGHSTVVDLVVPRPFNASGLPELSLDAARLCFHLNRTERSPAGLFHPVGQDGCRGGADKCHAQQGDSC